MASNDSWIESLRWQFKKAKDRYLKTHDLTDLQDCERLFRYLQAFDYPMAAPGRPDGE